MLPKSHPPGTYFKWKESTANLVNANLEQNTWDIYRWLHGCMLDEISCKLDDHQLVAVKGRSTTRTNSSHICHQAADNQKITRAAFVHFANAFDLVHRQIVLNKMVALGVQPFHHSMDALVFIRVSSTRENEHYRF